MSYLQRPVLIILDGHYSCICNLDMIELARDNHVTITSLSPHFTYKLKPLNRLFMWPLKKYHSGVVRVWVQKNGCPFTFYDIVENFNKAYIRTQMAAITINGFKVTGIYPMNRYIFTNADFIDAELDAGKKNVP